MMDDSAQETVMLRPISLSGESIIQERKEPTGRMTNGTVGWENCCSGGEDLVRTTETLGGENRKARHHASFSPVELKVIMIFSQSELQLLHVTTSTTAKLGGKTNEWNLCF